MSGFTFRPAVREQIRLLLGLSGGTGSGKTKSAMEIAKGLAGGKRFAVVDTENGRASMYADDYQFDVVQLTPPFTPNRYLEVIQAAEKAGYDMIVVDSMSHEWAGEGGILDMAEDELDRMAGDDWKKREACKMASWIKPKMSHKAMMAHMLQLKAHVILCFRAEPKIEISKDGGRWEVVPKKSLTGLDGWIPICEKNLPFELTASFLLTADRPGYPKPIKLNQHHKAFFPLDVPITEKSGVQMAEWAKGGTAKPPQQPPKDVVETQPGIFQPKEELVAKKWFTRIEQSPTIAMLKETGLLLKDAPLSDEDKKLARELYAARMKQLKELEPMI